MSTESAGIQWAEISIIAALTTVSVVAIIGMVWIPIIGGAVPGEIPAFGGIALGALANHLRTSRPQAELLQKS